MTDQSSQDPNADSENNSTNNPEEEQQDSSPLESSTSGSSPTEVQEIDEMAALNSQIRAWRIATILIVLAIFTICILSLVNSVKNIVSDKGLAKFGEILVERANREGNLSAKPLEYPGIVVRIKELGTQTWTRSQKMITKEIKALADNKKDLILKQTGEQMTNMIINIGVRNEAEFNNLLGRELQKHIGSLAKISGKTNVVQGVETEHQQWARDFNLKLMDATTNQSTEIVAMVFNKHTDELRTIRSNLNTIYDSEATTLREKRHPISLGDVLQMVTLAQRMLEKYNESLQAVIEAEKIQAENRANPGPTRRTSNGKN